MHLGLDNSSQIKSHDGKKTWKVILESLEELDYEVFWEVKDGQDYVPQHRERIFIVGFDRRRYGRNINFSFNFLVKSQKRKLKEILDGEVPLKYTLSDRLWQYLQDYAAKHRARGNGFGYGLANIEGITRTLSARYHKDGSEILIPQVDSNPRRLTPRECARLQGFPENFKIPVSDTQAYRQFGNSVVVPLVTAIAKQIFDTIENMEEGDGQQDSVVL